MKTVYEANDYRDFVRDALAADELRGAVKRLARELKVHSTFVSQVTKAKADFSVDQAARFCSYYGLGEDQTSFFLDMLHRDRAGTPEARSHYQARLDRRLGELADIKKRWRIDRTLSDEQRLKYYSSWIPQAVRMTCQLPGPHTEKSIAEALDLPVEKVVSTLADLESLGLVARDEGHYVTTDETIYLGKDDPQINRYHINWRLKTIADFTARERVPGVHFSSVLTLSEEAFRKVEEAILAHLDEVRSVVEPSPPETVGLYCLDFYPLRAED